MPINYVIRKKVDKTNKIPRELYYAVPKAFQKKGEGVDEMQLAEELHNRSSLSKGETLSVLVQLTDRIAHHLKEGRTITIRGLGTFYPSITSEGFETPEECSPGKVKVSRVCFRASKYLNEEVKKTKFVSLEWNELNSSLRKCNEKEY
ncbi:DNA-binding protein [Bacteroides sp. 224]|nr:DNA-binding protein [Bacteroides sp. 224]